MLRQETLASLMPLCPPSDKPDTAIHSGYVRVAIPSPLKRLFDYLPPEAMSADQIQSGARVQIPFGKQRIIGVVVAIEKETDVPPDKLKSVHQVLDEHSLIPDDIMALCQWAASYYHHSLGDTLNQAMPKTLRLGKPAVTDTVRHWFSSSSAASEEQEAALGRAHKQRAALKFIAGQSQGATNQALNDAGFSNAIVQQLNQKQLITARDLEPEHRPFTEIDDTIKTPPLTLNEEQLFAYEAVTDSLDAFRPFLLEGITGSGKTEVYLQIIAANLAKGKQTLVLVPEIGLTPQTVSRFRQRFHVPVSCLHSGLNDGERLAGWLSSARGSAGILIATRSGIFTPMPKLGLIIVDEEHDASYKQQDSLRYNARDLAIYRARQHDCPIVLGSATPSLESLHNAKCGRYSLLHLKQRAGTAKPPAMELLDIRQQPLQDGLSAELIHRIGSHLGRQNQVMLFLNRRGYAPSMICHDCGTIIDCPHCDAHMTLHRQPPHMHCHHCDLQTPIPWQCPSCQGRKLQPAGQGTERTEQVLKQRFPGYPVLRIDRDSTRKKQALAQMLEKINTGKPCLLLGTQMLAKGHHFPDVTLVAIINADAGLFSADFRGLERTGQLIMQVAGRAGRGDKSGEVIIQTHNPQHPSLQLLATNDYSRYASSLFTERQQLNLPPQGFLALIRAESPQSHDSEALLTALRHTMDSLHAQGSVKKEVRVLGPIPAPMEKRQGRYRWQLLLHGQNRSPLHQAVRHLVHQLESQRLPRHLKWTVDIDPQEMT